MRIKYSLSDLDKVYEKLVRYAESCIKERHYEKAVDVVDHAAHFQYYLNSIYSDTRLTKILYNVSEHFFSTKYLELNTVDDVVVFYDSFGRDNRCLTQQYIDSISENIANVIYIHESKIPNESIAIKSMLKNKNIQVYELGTSASLKKKAQVVRDIILRHKPSKCFFHLNPHTPIPFIAFCNIGGIEKYQINITDHAFWLGDSSFFDYTLEFRPFGCSLSVDRGFDKSRILLIPYYPWQTRTNFAGFPIDTKDKVVLFSGGTLYKLEGDDNSYFEIVRYLLSNNPQVVFFYAGDGNRTHINKFIKENNFEDQMFLLGNRSDILEVFEHSDIYLGTYPFGGGLMTQYAALCSLPILNYKLEDVEEVLCTKEKMHFTFDCIDDLLQEASRLINDKHYRMQRGQEFSHLVYNQGDFRNAFRKILEGTMVNEWSYEKPNGSNDNCLSRINTGHHKTKMETLVLKTSLQLLSVKMSVNLLLNIPHLIYRIGQELFRK